MSEKSCNVIGEEKGDFIPTATVRNSERLWRRSVELDRVIGKEVIIDPDTELKFQVSGQEMSSFEVTSNSPTRNTCRIATNLLTTMCKETSKRFNIAFSGEEAM